MSCPANWLRTLFAMVVLSLGAVGCARPATTAPTAPAAAAPAPERYQVFFDTDSAAIDARGQAVVAAIASVAAKDDKVSVRVIGKTDRVGAPPVNMALSKRRTEAVLAALNAAGVPTARIDWGWFGERAPDVATADEKTEPRNRVVDITVMKEPR